MAGNENDIMYNTGMRLEPSNAQGQGIMQKTSNDVGVMNVSGDPEGSVSANPASLACDRANGHFYLKESGTGNTGWSRLYPVGSIVGGPGVTVTESGGNLVVNSVVYTDQTATTLSSDSGTFATAAGAYTLPASPTDGELVEIVCITTGIIVTANTGQTIFLAGDSTSVAGTATNSAKADVLVLRYRSTDTAWYATSVLGVWTLA